jgi:glycerophosphoryl diester phosphodiesterase
MNDLIDQIGENEWRYPRWVAHRCGGSLAPENTLAGFDACLHYGYQMVEFDAKLSADEQIFLLQDHTLERTTSGWGSPAEWGWSELAQLDAGSWCDSSFAGERLPTLEQAAFRCKRDGLFANIEIKPNIGRELLTGQLVARAALSLWDKMTPPLLSSFSIPALEAARDAAPSLARGILFEVIPDNWLDIATGLGCVSVHADHRYLEARRVAEIRSHGFRMLTYTVNAPERARELVCWGVDMICTDRIDLIGADLLNRGDARQKG